MNMVNVAYRSIISTFVDNLSSFPTNASVLHYTRISCTINFVMLLHVIRQII